MKKEIIISIIILALVIIFDLITEKYTDKSLGEISSELRVYKRKCKSRE